MKLSPFALLPVIALGLTSPASAQQERHRIELDATVGTRFGGALDVSLDSDDGDLNGRLSADSSMAFGGIASLRFQSNGFVYFSYSRQETTIRFRPQNIDLENSETNASIEYFQFGGNLEIVRGRMTPYIGFSIGPGRFASQEGGGDSWRFSAVVDGGLKFRILPFLHLRLIGRLPITFGGGELYCYSGRGCVVAINNNPLIQGEFQGGVGLRF